MAVPDKNRGRSKSFRMLMAMFRTMILILIIVFVVILAIFFIRKAYGIGYEVTGYVPETGEDDVVQTMVTFTDEMTVRDLAELLIRRELIDESADAFVIQERISDHHGLLKPGTYVLSSSMTIEEMLDVMDGEEEENEEDE